MQFRITLTLRVRAAFRVFLGFPGGQYPRHATVLIHCVHGEGGLGPSGPRPALDPEITASGNFYRHFR